MTAGEVILHMLPVQIRARWLEERAFRASVGNVAWLLGEKIVRMGGGLLIGICIARYLGPARLGLLSYAGAFVSLFATLASLGLDGIVVREIVRDPARQGEILGTSFLLKLAGGGGCFLAALGAVRLLHPHDGVTCWLVGIGASGMLFLAFDVIDFRFQAEVRSRSTVLARCSSFLVIAALKLYLINTGAPLVAFAWAGAAEFLLAALGLVLFYRARGCSMRDWRPTTDCAGRLLKDSWPLIFSGFVIIVYMRIDQIMIAHLSGDREVGIYAVAVALAEAWYFIPTIIVSTLFPGIIAALGENDELFYNRLQKLYNLMALLGYLVAVPTSLLSGWVIRLLYGGAYAEAAPMLAVLIWAGLFVNLGVARGAYLTARNWTRIYFLTVTLGAVFNVCANLVLIPRLGGLGAVLASCLAYWFAAHGSCYLFAPLRRTASMMTRALLLPRPW